MTRCQWDTCGLFLVICEQFSSQTLRFSSPEPEAQLIFSDQNVSDVGLSVRPSVRVSWSFHIYDFFFFFFFFTKFTTNVPLWVLKKCCIYLKQPEMKDGSDWSRHFHRLLQNYWIWSHQTCQKCSSRSVITFQNDLISNMAAPVSDWLRHFDCFLPKPLRKRSPSLSQVLL